MKLDDDLSLLVIKPESIKSTCKIVQFIKKNNFILQKKILCNDWVSFARYIYTEFEEKELDVYLTAYKKYNFPSNFIVLILQHKNGNTINTLSSIKGHFLNYQINDKNSLRSKFGLNYTWNILCENRIFTLNGIHCVSTKDELLMTIKYLNSYLFNTNF